VNVANLSRAIDELLIEESTHQIYALVDTAQLQLAGRHDLLGFRSDDVICILGSGLESGAETVSPALIPLQPQQLKDLLSQMQELLEKANVVSFIFSQLDVSNLAIHLGGLTNIVDDDNTEWVMRFFDPRILPLWLDVLTPAQQKHVLAPIYRWVYIDPSAQVKTVVGGDDPLVRLAEPFRFELSQQNDLLEKTVPYNLIAAVEADDSGLIQDWSFFYRYEQFKRLADVAKNHGIHTMVDMKAFATLALRVRDDFLNDENVQKALLNAPKGRFHESLLAWDDQVWERLAVKV
jgi:hypothetical protein